MPGWISSVGFGPLTWMLSSATSTGVPSAPAFGVLGWRAAWLNQHRREGQHEPMRWELEAFGGGTRLTLWTNIGRRFISMGAAGWHICFDVLDRLLSGNPIGRFVGPEAMKFAGWQRLNAEYAKQFGVEPPNWSARAAKP
ncbi:MAG TPA: hypothetical protein VGR97_00215 [Candidatus Acidoferrales bacterium]|nr:hypothetical protein [Candidatus Acidoferrales bacterium]